MTVTHLLPFSFASDNASLLARFLIRLGGLFPPLILLNLFLARLSLALALARGSFLLLVITLLLSLLPARTRLAVLFQTIVSPILQTLVALGLLQLFGALLVLHVSFLGQVTRAVGDDLVHVGDLVFSVLGRVLRNDEAVVAEFSKQISDVLNA